MLRHNPSEDIDGFVSPEIPDRLSAILESMPKDALHFINDQDAATAQQLSRIHHSDYVQHLIQSTDKNLLLDFDTAIGRGSVQAAVIAAGTSIAAVRTACRQPGQATMAAVRPPGHHAEVDRAMGFCLFNNVAIAAQHAIDELDINRVCIIDWDVHHGNGTQNIFYERDDVLFISLHQSPLYPGSGYIEEIGRGPGHGYTINVPMPAGQMNADYLEVFDRIIDPATARFDPDLILISAGFDAHKDDPLGNMCITNDGFANMTRKCSMLAKSHCNGKLSFILEGGYSIPALTQSMNTCVATLAGTPIPETNQQTMPRTLEIIGRVKQTHPQWLS